MDMKMATQDSTTNEQVARRQEHTLKLRTQLKHVSIGSFPVSELEPLIKVMGLARNSWGVQDPTDDDLHIIQDRLSLVS